MTTFVKICPKCGHHNPEYENACSVCTYFIGMETPVATPQGEETSPQQSPSVEEPVTRTASSQPVSRAEMASPRQSLYLHALDSDLIVEIHDGATVGQAHPSSDADVQLRDLPGIDYVHRQHCQFSYRDGSWHVVPVDQGRFGREFTNPTVVNATKVAPGQSHLLKNGNQLSLANVKFIVRIV